MVTAPTDVIATIDVEGIESWTLSTRPRGEEGTVVLAAGTGPVEEALLGQFDPTLLLNGMHDLVLSGRDGAGQSVTGLIHLVVEGNMKIGYFSLSFRDLAIPLSGLDIEILRTYDSRQRHALGDFGYGWSLDIRQGSYKNNRPPGDGWQMAGGTLPCQAATETKSHLTTIRLSDREIYRFRTRLGGLAPTLGGCFAQAGFEYVDGTFPGAQLESLGTSQVIYQNGSNVVIDGDTLVLYEPRQVRLTTRDGRVFDFDLEQGVQRIAEANGNEVFITPTSISHSSGVGISIERDAAGLIERIVDPAGEVIQYHQDASGDLVQVLDRTAVATQFSYDSGHLLGTIVDALGRMPMRNEYDEEGRLVRHIDAAGKVYAFEHDLDGRREVLTDRLGRTRILTYDERGNIVREIDSQGHETVRTYDARDNLLSETDALERVVTRTYTAADDVASETDALGQTTRFTCDGAGRVLTTTDPRGGVTQRAYDVGGNVLQETDATGAVTTYTYDAGGRQLTKTDALGLVMSTSYDGRGNPTVITDSLGNETRFEYDDLGRQVLETRTRVLPDGTTGTLETQTEVDSEGRVARTVSADGSIHTTEFEYDPLGRLVARVWPDGAEQRFEYGPDGALARKIGARGVETQYTYDVQGDLVRRQNSEGDIVTFTYTASGQRSSYTDALGTTQYVWNDQDQLLSVTHADGRSLEYVYDALGNRTELIARTPATSLTTRYGYDGAHRLATVTDTVGGIYSMAYDGNGNRAQLAYPNGVTTTTEFDSVNRLTSLRTVTDGGAVLQSYLLSLDANGRRTRIEEAGGEAETYTYDALGRLVSTARLDAAGVEMGRQEWVYDAVGNRTESRLTDNAGATTTSVYAYDVRDRLLSVDGASYIYDGDGNLTARQNGGADLYAWSPDDRLRRAEMADGTVVESFYDPDGHLVRQTVDRIDEAPVTVDYLVDVSGDLSHVVLETDEAGNVLSHYVRGHELLAVLRPATGQQRYVHTDAVGSVRALSDGNGVVTDRYRYSAFGELVERQGDDPQPYRFTGEPFQAEMGWAYHRARWMDSSLGRFIGVDPFAGIPSDPLSLHRYLYAHADPANRVDPTGLLAGAVAVGGARLAGATIGLAILRQVLLTLARQFLLAGLAALITFGSVALAQALARDPAVIRARDRLKEKLDRIKKRKRIKDLLYHYTGKIAALIIVSTGFINASPPKRFGGFTFPSGAYGTDIPPFNPIMTQRQLSALFYGGSTLRDVSWFVAFEKLDFIPLLYSGFPGQFYRPAPPGFPVPIRRFFAGPTLMAP